MANAAWLMRLDVQETMYSSRPCIVLDCVQHAIQERSSLDLYTQSYRWMSNRIDENPGKSCQSHSWGFPRSPQGCDFHRGWTPKEKPNRNPLLAWGCDFQDLRGLCETLIEACRHSVGDNRCQWAILGVEDMMWH